MDSKKSIEIAAGSHPLLSREALNFISHLHEKFNPRRLELLDLRRLRQQRIDKGERPDFLKETQAVRSDVSWKTAPIPKDLQKRWVEITGPVDAKMMINALNSGADVFMADFEDALSPTWKNVIEGQQNLYNYARGKLTYTNPEGKEYSVKEHPATLMVRPRGWHLNEKHAKIDGETISASLFDFGLYFFHNAKQLLSKGTGPYFYLPKMESHLEARLWNDVFIEAQSLIGIPRGSIRATVLIETILAAFEMEEILYELREHSAGLNAGRWDYIFSIIKKFSHDGNFVFPDRGQITMTVPFMRAYTKLLVATCHRRGAHAMGGMAAFIPNRKDPAITEQALKKVTEDKLREVTDGFDGTWVAHPDLVPVAHEVFEKHLKGQPNQIDTHRDDPHITSKDLLAFAIPDGQITENGIRHNIDVALQYLNAWLQGVGAAALYNLMEDAATAEISRSQLWQWVHRGKLTKELYKKYAEEESAKLKKGQEGRYDEARTLLDAWVLEDRFSEFLTLPAYEHLDT